MKIFVDVADTPEREKLVAEAFVDDLQWCELSQDGGILSLTFLARPESAPVVIDFDVAIAVLKFMKDFLENGEASEQRPEWLSLE
jgi:hypothetical protein